MPDVNHSAATVLHDSKATALTVGTDTPSRADILVYNDAASGGLYRTTGTSGTGDVQKVGLNSDDIANFETTTELNARDTANRDRANHTGTQAISTVTNLQTTLDTKLESSDIADFETTTQLNARDTANRDRANHTGTQLLATISDAGTAAALDVGTSANNVVQLDGSARLPAVDGSQLTNLPAGITLLGRTSTAVRSTGSVAIPYDDTIPQITEGTEFMTVTVTPGSASSTLWIRCKAWLSEVTNTSDRITGAVFVDSTSDAILAGVLTPRDNLNLTQGELILEDQFSSGSTTARTYRFRAGLDTANAIEFNGASNGRKFGGVMKSFIEVWEISA